MPRRYADISKQELKRLESFSRDFPSSEVARETLISFGYEADRVDGWFSSSPPRVYEKDGRIWSCINPLAQHLGSLPARFRLAGIWPSRRC